MVTNVERVQMYLHTKYQQHDIIAGALFQLYFHPDDNGVEANTAVPLQSGGDWETAVDEVIDQFTQRQRTPRIQFLDTFAPTLPAALTGMGLQLAHQTAVLTCTPETYRPAPTMPGLSTIILSSEFSLDDVQQEMQTRELGFNPAASRPTGTDALTFEKTLLTDRAFLLRLNREPVAGGMFAEIRLGVTELVGVTTLPEFRRRGFAAYLTGYMTQVAFARQVDIVFMLLDRAEAVNVFKRVGYFACARLLTYEPGS